MESLTICVGDGGRMNGQAYGRGVSCFPLHPDLYSDFELVFLRSTQAIRSGRAYIRLRSDRGMEGGGSG